MPPSISEQALSKIDGGFSMIRPVGPETYIKECKRIVKPMKVKRMFDL